MGHAFKHSDVGVRRDQCRPMDSLASAAATVMAWVSIDGAWSAKDLPFTYQFLVGDLTLFFVDMVALQYALHIFVKVYGFARRYTLKQLKRMDIEDLTDDVQPILFWF